MADSPNPNPAFTPGLGPRQLMPAGGQNPQYPGQPPQGTGVHPDTVFSAYIPECRVVTVTATVKETNQISPVSVNVVCMRTKQLNTYNDCYIQCYPMPVNSAF